MEKTTCAFLIVILIIAFTMPFSFALPDQAEIYVDPPHIIDTGISPSQNITVNIMVANVTDLFSWQVKIYYNATILNVTKVSLPLNHVFAGRDYMPAGPVINNTEGYVWFTVALMWVDPMWTFNGTGVLCRISFSVKAGGYTSLHFYPPAATWLRDRNLNLIPVSTHDGFYEYKYAVVNLEVKPNRYVTDRLETFDIGVWLNNVTEGDRVIGAQFRLKYNATLLAVQDVLEGPFFRQFKSRPEEPYTQFVWYNITSRDEDPQNYDLLGPHLLVGVTILSNEGQYSVFPNGNGILATVTFRGIYRSFYGALNSTLELADIEIVDDGVARGLPEPNLIATISPINGYYEISPISIRPMLKVQPGIYDAKKKGEVFNINVTIANLDPDAQLNNVEFKLTYNATVLEVVNIVECPFLQGFGKTAFSYSVGSNNVTIQNRLETLFAGFPNGNGTVATIAFKAIRRGFYPEETNSTLNLTEIVLLDIYQNRIPTSTLKNGFYKILSLRSPTASFPYSPNEPYVGDAVTFNATQSYDIDGYIVSYEWNFGDGNVTTVTSSVITHSYMAPGKYNVTLTVSDDDGLSDSTAKTVIVKAKPVGIPLDIVVIVVLGTIVIATAIVIYYKRIRK